MEKKLSEAALQGDAMTLEQILTEDLLILDRIIVSCISETPLHTVAALGHLRFVKLLLSRTPELAAELDSRGCSPLHLAAAKGHADVVTELLREGGKSGSVRNADGRNPLHVAAVKGRAACWRNDLGVVQSQILLHLHMYLLTPHLKPSQQLMMQQLTQRLLRSSARWLLGRGRWNSALA